MTCCCIAAVRPDVVTQDLPVIGFPLALHRASEEEVLRLDVLQPHPVPGELRNFIRFIVNFYTIFIVLYPFLYQFFYI